MRTSPLATAVALAMLAGSSFGAEHPVGGDRLRLRDPRDPAERRVLFRAGREPAVAPTLADDPRLLGATLEIRGLDPGDGTSGTLQLPQGFWTGLGRPAGSKGFRFVDPGGTTGVRRVVYKRGNAGGTLTVGGRGAAWPYAITQPQGPIEVRFTVGDEVYCARFATYVHNAAGKVNGRNAPPPAACDGGSGPRCGDGAVEDGEQCDDGNTIGDDGCSALCQLENPNCGDGAVDGTEECDDGNPTGGDGCSALCQLESTAARCTGVASVPGTGLDAVRIAAGLDAPVHVTTPPLDTKRLFVVEQDGRIRIIKNGTLLPQAFLAIEGRVSCCGERGLLSMAFHPDYENNRRFFVYYTDNGGDLVIARYEATANPDIADQSTERILLTIEHSSAGNHNGGQLAFGPDGYLYAGTGDGGGGGDPFENGQNDATLLGKLLRLDVDVGGPSYYAIPPTNPFVGVGDARPEIWAKGLRNPWRFGFDRANGDLYLGDVGQNSWEEVDVQPAASPGGENYGWDIFEGNGHCFEPAPGPTCPSPPTGFTMPVLEYANGGDVDCSITGGAVYRGCRMPDLHGTYFYSDFCTPFIRTFRGVVGGVAQNQADRTADVAPGGGLSIDTVVSFGEDARGEIYMADFDGEIYRLVPGP